MGTASFALGCIANQRRGKHVLPERLSPAVSLKSTSQLGCQLREEVEIAFGADLPTSLRWEARAPSGALSSLKGGFMNLGTQDIFLLAIAVGIWVAVLFGTNLIS
jgi:hypothetical protein